MATYSWNSTSGAFGFAPNWGLAGLPGASDIALFGPSSATYTIGGIGTVASLQFLAGGSWALSGAVSTGNAGDLGTLTVLSGGTLTLTSGLFAIGGANGADGTLLINAGGTVRSTVAAQTSGNLVTIGGSGGSTGAVTVSGAGALLDGGLNPGGIGNIGAGMLTVANGGTASFASTNSAVAAALTAGRVTGSSASIAVTGAGSTLMASGYTYLGRAGTATLTVSAGGTFTGGSAATGTVAGYSITIGDGSPGTDSTGTPIAKPDFGGSATATVTGSGSLLRSLNQIRIGYRGTTGSLVVDNGATARADTNFVIGGGTDRAGAAGTLIVRNGATAMAGGRHTITLAGVVFGADAGTSGSGTVSGAGSVLDANGDRLTIGGSGTGSLSITGGGRASSGSAGYSDVEAALSVASGLGSSGTLAITGAGSDLTVAGNAVIGGNQRGAGLTVGGSGTVSVTGGGSLRISGVTTIQVGSSLTVDGASTLTAGAITINGGAASLAQLSAATAVTFGIGGKLSVGAVSGNNIINSFAFGDTIDLVGQTDVRLSGNVVTTAGGTLTLAGAAAGLRLTDDGSGGTLVSLNAKTIGVYRFFDSLYGTHFYTASESEAQQVAAARPDMVAEGVGGIGLQALAGSAGDPNAVAVFRFFDTVYGTHFFTASAAERDTVIATRSDLQYESSSIFYEHATEQPGDTPVYRFFDNVRGTHFYTDDAAERANIMASRTDLVAEGIGFYEPKQN